VYEWNDTEVPSGLRGLCGGSYEFYAEQLRADRISAAGEYSHGYGIGFRVAFIPVPEPVTWVSLMMAATCGLVVRYRRNDG
jgi:hypothetical protein